MVGSFSTIFLGYTEAKFRTNSNKYGQYGYVEGQTGVFGYLVYVFWSLLHSQ
jgi:hypothetical protein